MPAKRTKSNNRNCTGLILVGIKAPRWLALPVYGYITPIVTIITAGTNSCVVLILSQKRFLQSPTNIVLLSMAITELLTGLSSLPWSLYYYTLKGYVTEENEGLPEFWCESFPYMSERLPTIFHTAAIWLTVFLAIQRYRQVVKRSYLGAVSSNEVSKTIVIIAAICCASVLCELPKIISSGQFSRRIEGMIYFEGGEKIHIIYRACIYKNSPWVQKMGTNMFFGTYYWLLAVLVHILPSILLIVFTSYLLRYLKRADERRNSTLRGLPSIRRPQCTGGPRQVSDMRFMPGRKPRQMRSFHASTRMLTVIIAIFLIIELPAATIYILHVFTVTLQFNRKVYEAMNMVFVIRNLAILVSYPVNFAVYCGMSKQFRLAFAQIILRRGPPPEQSGDCGGEATSLRPSMRHGAAKRRKSSTPNVMPRNEHPSIPDALAISLMIQSGHELPSGLEESELL